MLALPASSAKCRGSRPSRVLASNHALASLCSSNAWEQEREWLLSTTARQHQVNGNNMSDVFQWTK